MTDPVSVADLQKRISGWASQLYALSYERVQHARRLEEIDPQIGTLENLIEQARIALKNIQADTAVQAALHSEELDKLRKELSAQPTAAEKAE